MSCKPLSFHLALIGFSLYSAFVIHWFLAISDY